MVSAYLYIFLCVNLLEISIEMIVFVCRKRSKKGKNILQDKIIDQQILQMKCDKRFNNFSDPTFIYIDPKSEYEKAKC